MLRLTNGPLAPWDVISSESKRNGRVEVIETVIRHMEAGMERWGVPVPHSDDEEKTELALSFDDAEFQHDPASIGVEWCGRAWHGCRRRRCRPLASGAAEHLSA